MVIYTYHKDTLEYLLQKEARIDPLDNTRYLIPANATTKQPLDKKDGYSIVFNKENKNWEYIEDNRGKTSYNIETKGASTVDYLGEIKDGYTLEKPLEMESYCKFIDTKWVIDEEEKSTYQINKYKKDAENAIQNLIDTTARKYRYDNMNSVAKYLRESSPFYDEAVKLLDWCDACWVKAGGIEQDVLNGTRELPTTEELLNELPKYEE